MKYTTNDGHKIQKGDIFGESSFFTSKLRETGAKSLSVSHLVFCTYEDFVSVLAQFPKDYVIIVVKPKPDNLFYRKSFAR